MTQPQMVATIGRWRKDTAEFVARTQHQFAMTCPTRYVAKIYLRPLGELTLGTNRPMTLDEVLGLSRLIDK